MLPLDRPVICPVLIGRASLVDALHCYLDTVKTEVAPTILISGEAGVGKSRLTREIEQYAIAQGYQILQGNCFPYDLDHPYAPILNLLRSYLVNNAEDREFLERERFPLLPEMIPTVRDTTLLSNPEQEKRRFFAILTQLFIQKAAQQPVLYIIEDIHWSDDVSLDFLHYLARHLAKAALPFLLVITYRSDEMQPMLQHWLAQIDRERLAHELPLNRLNRNDVEMMLNAMYEPSRPLRSDFVETIYALTEGNPFFIEEVVKSLSNMDDVLFSGEGQMSVNKLPIPRSVQAAVLGRFHHLSDAARHLVILAAVIGRQFDFDLLQMLSQLDEDELLQIIKELIAAQLIVEQSTDEFAFRHALTRQAIYTTLLTRERKALHSRIGGLMEQIHAPTLEAYAADLSYHYHMADVRDKTLQYAHIAGNQALNLYALNAAAEHFTRALAAARDPDTAPLIELYSLRGTVYELLGKFEHARNDLEIALELARTGQDRAAVWGNLLALGFLWTSRDYRRTGDYYQQALDLAETMSDPAMLGNSLNRLGNWYANAEQPDKAQQYHRQALEIFEQLNNQQGLAETFDLLGMAYFLGGDVFQSIDYLERAITHFSTLNHRSGLVSSLATIALNAVSTHTDILALPPKLPDELLQKAETALQIARDSGLRPGEVFSLTTMAYLTGGQGDYERALALLEQSLAIAKELGHRQWITLTHFGIGLTLSDIFDLDGAQKNLEIALHLARESGSLYWQRISTGCLAGVYVIQGRYVEAKAILDTAIEEHIPAHTIAQRMCWRARAELALAQNDSYAALQITKMLAVAELNSEENKQNIIPRVALLQGEALLQLQRLDEAERVLLSLVAALQVHSAKPLLWRTYAVLGKVYLAQKQTDKTEDIFEAARQIIDSLVDKIPDTALRNNFLVHANTLIPQSRPLTLRQADKKAFGGLTAREREIAHCVAQGKSNREISDLLVISERTAEAHVSNILNKLGFSSRSQIAVWAVEKGLHRTDGDDS